MTATLVITNNLDFDQTAISVVIYIRKLFYPLPKSTINTFYLPKKLGKRKKIITPDNKTWPPKNVAKPQRQSNKKKKMLR